MLYRLFSFLVFSVGSVLDLPQEETAVVSPKI